MYAASDSAIFLYGGVGDGVGEVLVYEGFRDPGVDHKKSPVCEIWVLIEGEHLIRGDNGDDGE